MKKLWLTFILTIVVLYSFSQESDTIMVKDTSHHHSPKKAIIFSAIIPVSGQIYNHFHFEKGQKCKNNIYWKLPLFYTALGYTSYSLIQNQSIQKSLKTEYNYRIANNSSSNQEWINYDNSGILTLTKAYESKRDFSILMFGAAYLIQIIDAGIEAHFVSFDISENLALKVHPKFYSTQAVGMGLSLCLKN